MSSVRPSLFDPFYLSHKALTKEVATMAADIRGVVVDVGCGAKPYLDMFVRTTYFGIEVPTASAHGSAKMPDALFDGRQLPILDSSVDAIFCSQVLEHVFDPTGFLNEIQRVLRPGGKLLLTVPFVWDEHEQPYDFARYSSFGLHHLAKISGFEVTYSSRTLGDASIFAQLWIAYWFKALKKLPSVVRKPLLALIAFLSNLTGLLMRMILPRSPDLYLDNAMIWTKLDVSQTRSLADAKTRPAASESAF